MCSFFLAKQNQIETKLNQWIELAPEKLRVDFVTSYSGNKVYALSVSNFDRDLSHKRSHYFAQPHAHEPSATAGIMDVIEQLLTGRDLLGAPTSLDLEDVLSKTVLTFNPIGNPQGRALSPVLWWDGSKYSNDEFWCWMRGEDPDNPGHMWKRLDIWDLRKENAPDPIGIVYEQIDEFRYVEPNRSQLSSYFRLFHRMDKQYHYHAWLDLHQTEFVNSEFNCEILLPISGDSEGYIKDYNKDWGKAIIHAWQNAGYSPCPEPKALGYTGQQANYFRQNWGNLHKRMNIINTEVKNNATDANPEFQMKAQSIAIVKSIEKLLE